MEYLKYEHQSIFPLWGGSNLISGTGMENQIFILGTSAAVKFFYRIVRKDFGIILQTLTWILPHDVTVSSSCLC